MTADRAAEALYACAECGGTGRVNAAWDDLRDADDCPGCGGSGFHRALTAPAEALDLGAVEARPDWINALGATLRRQRDEARTERDEALARVRALEAAEARVRELHNPRGFGYQPRCRGCREVYPCRTIAALDGAS